MLGPVKKNTLYLVTICDLSKKITCSSIILGLPPKADYWKYFNVVGVVAYCLIAECKQPNVSLGALPKPGDKKRIVLTFALKLFFRYLTAPATSTAVERLFSAAGLILDAKRSKLDPSWVDHILFLREAFLLGNCKLEWE